jgi:hypothetical protein
MYKTTISFDLIEVANEKYVMDVSDIEINGKINLTLFDTFMFDESILNNLANDKEFPCRITLELSIDSDDDCTWYDYKEI